MIFNGKLFGFSFWKLWKALLIFIIISFQHAWIKFMIFHGDEKENHELLRKSLNLADCSGRNNGGLITISLRQDFYDSYFSFPKYSRTIIGISFSIVIIRCTSGWKEVIKNRALCAENGEKWGHCNLSWVKWSFIDSCFSQF